MGNTLTYAVHLTI